jgi:U6 snRNA-associated Sm-like protein LSm6
LTLLLTCSFPFFVSKDDSSATASKKRSPSDFLKSVLGRPVRVKLNSGIEYRGVLASLDGFLNIAMEQTEEFVDGQLKAKYGDAFIRGNNGTYMTLNALL